jgi:hypothetical protein
VIGRCSLAGTAGAALPIVLANKPEPTDGAVRDAKKPTFGRMCARLPSALGDTTRMARAVDRCGVVLLVACQILTGTAAAVVLASPPQGIYANLKAMPRARVRILTVLQVQQRNRHVPVSLPTSIPSLSVAARRLADWSLFMQGLLLRGMSENGLPNAITMALGPPPL